MRLMTTATVFGVLSVALAVLNLSQYRAAKAADQNAQEVYDRFQNLFHTHVWAVGEKRPTFMGIETLQFPLDAWLHHEIIFDVKPDFIVETGTWKGGGALLWASYLQHANPKGKVITIDIDDNCQEARKLPFWQEKIEFLHGSSTDSKIVAQVLKRVQGGRVMVILDSDHSKDHVVGEMKAYAPEVSVGSYLVVQDTYYDHPPAIHASRGPGPYSAVQEFLAANKQFEIDTARERFLVSYNPKGYLKRVR